MLLLLGACGESPAPSPDAVADADADAGRDAGAADGAALDATAADGGNGPDAGTADFGELYLTRLENPADFDRLQGTKTHVKYLAPVRSATAAPPLTEPCYFQNMMAFEWHVFFLRSFPELAALTNQQYVSYVLQRPTRIWWGGGVERLRRPHPISGAAEVLAYTIYSETNLDSRLVEADIVEVDGILRGCVPYATDLLAFEPGDPYQIQLAQQLEASLRARGIAVVFP